MQSSSGPEIFWCVSARNASTRCAGIYLNMATPSHRASTMLHPWSPSSRIRDLPCRKVRSVLKVLVDTFTGLEAQIATLDTEITQSSKTDPTDVG